MKQNIFVKEDIIPGSQTLDGYRVVVHNTEINQYGSWTTDSNSCHFDTNFGADPDELEYRLTVQQDYNKVDLDFILGDRFQYACKNKAIINTTRRITNLMQELIIDPRNKLLGDVNAFQREYLLPGIEGEARKDARVSFADALENWFEGKVSDTHNIWFDFLREIIAYVDWKLIAQFLDVGHWVYQPKLDSTSYEYYTNSLTWTVVYFIESNESDGRLADARLIERLIKSHLEQKADINVLADQLHDWFVKKLPYSTTTRAVNAQLVLAGIDCVDWCNVARSLLPDSEN
jgi:hypothetical protein